MKDQQYRYHFKVPKECLAFRLYDEIKLTSPLISDAGADQEVPGLILEIWRFINHVTRRSVSVAEPEPQGAASFGRSWSRNKMRL
jgi:hypothetical protein